MDFKNSGLKLDQAYSAGWLSDNSSQMLSFFDWLAGYYPPSDPVINPDFLNATTRILYSAHGTKEVRLYFRSGDMTYTVSLDHTEIHTALSTGQIHLPLSAQARILFGHKVRDLWQEIYLMTEAIKMDGAWSKGEDYPIGIKAAKHNYQPIEFPTLPPITPDMSKFEGYKTAPPKELEELEELEAALKKPVSMNTAPVEGKLAEATVNISDPMQKATIPTKATVDFGDAVYAMTGGADLPEAVEIDFNAVDKKAVDSIFIDSAKPANPSKFKSHKGVGNMKDNMEQMEACKLRDAKALYQPILGTDSGSRYFVVAMSTAMNVAARYQGMRLSVRVAPTAEAKVLNETQMAACGLDMKEGGHASIHLPSIDPSQFRRLLGALLLDLMNEEGVPIVTNVAPLVGAGS